MLWTAEKLRPLTRRHGVRLRGLEMTRLETFVDAAFAFSMSLLVIAVDGLPTTFPQLTEALLGIPAFAASFALIMMFWFSHRQWSQRYGLEDTPATLISLGLVFIVLVYVYPLRVMFSTFFSWVTGGFLPSQFEITALHEGVGLFAAYGIGTLAMAGTLAALNYHALRCADSLGLDAIERLRTQQQVAIWTVQATIGLSYALFALLAPGNLGVFAGFAYCVLPIIMPITSLRYERRIEAIESP